MHDIPDPAWKGRGPEEPEPEPRFYCDRCGDGLHEGDAYYDISNEVLCFECMDDVCRKLA